MAGVLPYTAKDGIILNYPEKSSAAFAKNDLVYLDDSTGQIDVCGADPALILGVALQTASGTAGTSIPVLVIRPGDLFIMRCSTTTAQAYVGDRYGIVTTTGALTVDVTDATNERVCVMGLDERDAVGTSGGRMIVSFIPEILHSAQKVA